MLNGGFRNWNRGRVALTNPSLHCPLLTLPYPTPSLKSSHSVGRALKTPLVDPNVLIISAKADVMRPGRFVCHSICRINSKVISPFHWNLMLRLAYQSEELINFWWWYGPGHGFRITFPLSSPLRNEGILEDLLAFLIQSLADFHDTQRNDWRRHDDEFTTFWERCGRHRDPNLD